MSFYVKHLRGLMQRAGAEYNPENKELMDRAVRQVLEMERADAPEVWGRVKEILFEEGNTEKRKEFEESVIKLMVKFLITG